ncbi:hypothetical protein [Marinomonas hwangdonensis]|uniref:hypothetical protein n=1 Tax=Marinomonas hwangdonensis TaxID=1053647 RepID=UPI0013145935|nr:hypothetical protein [Marinomonas hwangdonensis]
MKLTFAIIIVFSVVIVFNWQPNDHNIAVTLPSDGQLKEMIGVSNTPSIPLTPIQH